MNFSGKLSFEQRLFWLGLIGALPASLLLLWLLVKHDYSGYLITLMTIFLVVHVGLCAYQIKFKITHQFRTLTNLLEALSNDDFSLRARPSGHPGALHALISQVNNLADLLTEQRYAVKETELLLAKVIAQIDVAVFTFDSEQRLTLVNRAGASLYRKDIDDLRHTTASRLGLDGVLNKNGQVVELNFIGQTNRFHINTEQFIDHNERHTLLFMTNVQAALREEERKAWQNLIRVISHELNNSLTPIASISQSLMSMNTLEQTLMRENLGLINERANSLSAFIQSYQELAKLPTPTAENLDIHSELKQVATLFPKIKFYFEGEKSELKADPAQLRQLLINLFKNAYEASVNQSKATEKEIAVSVHWQQDGDWFELRIKDEGPGIQNPSNIFVPFYTTKPGGSGIGLVLCRQIAEGHGGNLSLTNAAGGGCIATLKLPLDFPLNHQ